MDYKIVIHDLVDKIRSEEALKRIYLLVFYLYSKETSD